MSLLTMPYTHDGAGLTSSANPPGTTPATPTNFSYDPANRLVADSVPGTSVPVRQYNYDQTGNLTSIGISASSISQQFDVADQLTTATGSAAGQPIINTAYTSDINGRRSSTLSTSATNGDTLSQQNYSYNQADQLTGYTSKVNNLVAAQTGVNPDPTTTTVEEFLSGGTNVNVGATAAYDGDGLLTGCGCQAVPSSTNGLVWDKSTAVPTVINDGYYTYLTGPGGRIVEDISPNGIARYYHQDALGSTRLITTAGGKILGRYDYDPYGNLTVDSGSIVTPFLFNGQYTATTWGGLIYLRARWYDPKTGQFLTRDPLEDTTGAPYSYAGGNPIDNVDPTGMCWWTWDDGACPGAQTLENVLTSGPGKAVSDFLIGVGDGATLGGTGAIREAISPGSSCTFDHGVLYGTGYGLGLIGTVVATGGTASGEEGGGLLRLSTEDSWGNPTTLARHFRDHGADFGASSAEEYATQASDFFERGIQDGMPIKIDGDGMIRIYDPETNTFGAYNADGTTRTFFKPTSPTYWNRQPGSAP